MAQLVKLPGTVVRSVNGIKPDENANVTVPQPSILDAYPVGSIYMSVMGTNPAELFGGTWEDIAHGSVLIGAGEDGWGINHQAGAVGGTREYTLKESNIPKHKHTISIEYAGGTHSHLNGVYDEVKAGLGPHSTNYGSVAKSPTGLQHVMYADSETYGSTNTLYMGKTSPESTSHKHDATIGYYGTSSPTPVSVVQPYLVVYIWKRTA